MRSVHLLVACLLLSVFSTAGEVGGERFAGFRLPYYRDDGSLAWVLETEEIRRLGENEVELLSPKVSVYSGERGAEWVSSILTAAKGAMELKSQQVVPSSPNASLSGGVKILLLDREGKATGSLSSDTLDWDGESETASGGGEATLEFEQNWVRGTGFKFEMATGRFHLEKDISGTLGGFSLPTAFSEEQMPVEVECAGPTLFDIQEKKIQMHNDVKATSADNVLTTAFLAVTIGEERALTSLEAEGDVEIRSARLVGSADRLDWSAETNVVRFEGSPLRLSSGEWSYVAEKGEYHPGVDRFLAAGVSRVEYTGEESVMVSFDQPGELEATEEVVVLRGRPEVVGLLGEGRLSSDMLLLRRGAEKDEQIIEASGNVTLEQGEAALTCSRLTFAREEHRLDARDDVRVKHPEMSLNAARLMLDLDENNESVVLGEAKGVELSSDGFFAEAEEAVWSPGPGGEPGVTEFASSVVGSGKLTLTGKPRVEVENAQLAGEAALSDKLVLKADERITFDFEKGVIEPVGSPEIRSGDMLIRARRLRVILDDPPAKTVKEVEGDGGVYVTNGRIRAEAESLRAYGTGERSIQLMRDIRIRYPIEEKEYSGEAVITATGSAKWDVAKGMLEITRDIILLMEPYKAKGDRAEAKISGETNQLNSITLYGKPAMVEGTGFSVPAEEITALVNERRVKVRKGSRGIWHVRGKGDENQSAEETAE